MEPERVPKSFGCLPHRNLKLSISRSRSKSASSSTSSPRTPKSPSVTPRKSTSSSTKSKEEEYREVFRRFDNDNDGRISAVELRAYFGSVGEYMSHEDAEAVIRDADSDGDSLIDFQDFLTLMKKEGSEDEDLKAAFEMFEFQKGSGRITPKSLQKVLSRLGDAKSYDECVEMIEVHDTDGKGELHFHEFQQMMMA